MGNTSTCMCDVLVLSCKKTCNDTLSLPHVEYIFNSSTTWTTGRNLLLEVAMLRRETYLYYIFLDDDIVLFGIQETTLEGSLKIHLEKWSQQWQHYQLFGVTNKSVLMHTIGFIK